MSKPSLFINNLDMFLDKGLLTILFLKGAATEIGYFARSKFFRSQVHKKTFSLIWQVVLELVYVFCQER